MDIGVLHADVQWKFTITNTKLLLLSAKMGVKMLTIRDSYFSNLFKRKPYSYSAFHNKLQLRVLYIIKKTLH